MAGGEDAAQPRGPAPSMPIKQKMAVSFKSLLDGAKKLALGDDGTSHAGGPAPLEKLFARTRREVDGPDCEHDCETCTVHYPRNFKVEEADLLYGHVKPWSTHVLVATGKTDWVRDVEDEKGSVMQAIGRASKPSNGRLMLSASNIPTPGHTSDYSEPTTVLLLPAFVVIENVTPDAVPSLITEFVDKAPTNDSPLAPLALPTSLDPQGPAAETNGSASVAASTPPPPPPEESAEPPPAATTAAIPAAPTTATTTATPPIPPHLTLRRRPCPHSALVLLCSQKTRDARCGQSAPLLRKELERHLRPLGLYRDLDDERPGGVGIYFISHVGGHKYSANVMVYRRPDAFGLDGVERAKAGEAVVPRKTAASKKKEGVAGSNGEGSNGAAADGDGSNGVATDGEDGEDVGAAQCIWLARVRPEDCENLVRYTVLQGKVVKPERQLRGGFDRSKGLMSW